MAKKKSGKQSQFTFSTLEHPQLWQITYFSHGGEGLSQTNTHCHKNQNTCKHSTHTQAHTHKHNSRIAVKTGIDEKAQSMTIRGKQRLPLASQSMARAFWVILAHIHPDRGIHTSTARGHPQGRLNHILKCTHIHTEVDAGVHSFYHGVRYLLKLHT